MFKIGDTVLYSRSFLRATGQLMEQGHKGRIIRLEPISKGLDFALVEWPRGCPFPPKVLTSNLVRADKLHFERV
jgi:hypothetical protein